MRETTDVSPTCRLVTDAGDWTSLREDWERLYRLTPDITPWQSWDFLSRWWRTQRGSRALRMVVIEYDGVVQMILPLQLSTVAPFRLRVLEPLGMPDDINRPRLTIGVPDATAFAMAMQLLWQHRHEWDALRIDEKRDNDIETAWLRDFVRSQHLRLEHQPFLPCPYLELTQWDTYIRSRSPHLVKNLRAARRRLEAKGTVVAQRFDEPSEVLRAFDLLVNVHERSWKHAACVGLGQSDSYRRFFREFVAAQAARHRARAWVLSCDAQPIAATLAFHDGSTYHSAYIAHDDAFSECSPGTLLESIELQDLMAEGRFRTYDFLAGALQNKLRWTDSVHQTTRIWLVRPSPRGALFTLYYFKIKPLIKMLRPNR